MNPSIRSITLHSVSATPTKMISFVIFDMDGTLLDTEKLFRRSWIETSEDHGLPDSESFYEFVAGSPAILLREKFLHTYGNGVDYDEFLARRKQKFLSYIQNDVPLKPHCVELLDYLKSEGVKIALATSTNIEITRNNLEKSGILKYFDAIVTGDEVRNGKPAPDIFLLAAERISAIKDETVIVEDTYNGLRGAFAAGIRGIMVIDGQMPNEETHRIAVCECQDLNEVLNYIKTHKGEKRK